MKTRLAAALAISLAFISSCTLQRRENSVTETAQMFLEAFYSMDYEAAAACSTEEFASKLEAGADYSSLPAPIALKVKEAAAATSFEIISIDVDSSD